MSGNKKNTVKMENYLVVWRQKINDNGDFDDFIRSFSKFKKAQDYYTTKLNSDHILFAAFTAVIASDKHDPIPNIDSFLSTYEERKKAIDPKEVLANMIREWGSSDNPEQRLEAHFVEQEIYNKLEQ